MTTSQTTSFLSAPEKHSSASAYNLALGYLRAFVVVLVLAHHAVLAYYPFAPPPGASLLTQPRWWEAFPVVDSQRWSGFGLFVGFNDVFFMSLMFFLSGLFVWNSVQRKGSGTFLRERAVRLGAPFLIAAALVAPLAYYPAYLQRNAHPTLAAFWHQWLSLGEWPAGPAWFVWVLLAFDCVALLLFALAPRWGETLGRLTSGLSRRPVSFFALLVAVSAAAYIPMALAFNPFVWATFGPFTFQTSRILHYLVYFLTGVVVGAYGTNRGLLATDGKLARRWPVWTIASLLVFAIAVIVFIAASTSHVKSHAWAVMGDFSFTLSCATSGFACLAVFIRFFRSRVRLFDSLNRNSYGMYLIHWMFVSWLQYALLKAHWPAISKASIVFLGTLAISWGVTSALRRISIVGRVI